MLRAIILTIIFLLGASTAIAADLNKIESSVASWNPLSVEKTGDKVAISIDQGKVTMLIYRTLITSGLCLHQAANPEMLHGIAEVAILNRFKGQGFVYEIAEAECPAIVALPTGQAKLMLLGATHVY